MTREDDVEQLVGLVRATVTVMRELERDLTAAGLPEKAALARHTRIAIANAANRVSRSRAPELRRTGEWKPPAKK